MIILFSLCLALSYLCLENRVGTIFKSIMLKVFFSFIINRLCFSNIPKCSKAFFLQLANLSKNITFSKNSKCQNNNFIGNFSCFVI